MKKLLIIFIVSTLAYSCKTVKINEHQFADVPFPKDFRERLFLQNSDQIRDDISDILGRLITIDPQGKTGKIESRRLLVNDANPKVNAIENGIIYESKNNLSTSSDLKFILSNDFLESNTSTNAFIETIVEDIVVARVADDDIDWQRIANFVKSLENQDESKRYCVITQTRLTNLMLKTYTEINNESKIAIGDVFKAGGKIYNSNSERVLDYTVSCQCLDIVNLVRTSVSNQASELSDLEKSRNLIISLRSAMDLNGDLLHSTISSIDLQGRIELKK